MVYERGPEISVDGSGKCMPMLVMTGHHCGADKRIAMIQSQTVSSCNDQCLMYSHCESFEFGKKDFWKNRCDLYEKGCKKLPTHEFDTYKTCELKPTQDGWLEELYKGGRD